MAKTRAFSHSLNVGEISIAGLARVDQEKLRLGTELQRNIIPAVIGKGQMRPGLQYTGASASNNRPRGVPFIKSVDDFADLELTDGLLRVWVDDALVTRAAVTSTVTNGDFSSATGWTLTVASGATGNINSTSAGALFMTAPARGSSVICTRSVTTSSTGIEHALRIVITYGTVTFRCGSSSGADDYIGETTLDAGVHSLSFTPTGDYHVWFKTKPERTAIIDSIQVEAAGVMSLTAPWTEAELREIRFDQSADIVYLAHSNWQTQKIERRSITSWSLVGYHADDGPFTLTRTADVKLTPGATHGLTTLTASSAFFRPEHVGCLFRLTHDVRVQTWSLAGLLEKTDAIRVVGIGSDNDFTITRAGTWTATLTVERSYDDRDNGFIATSTTYTTNAATAFSPGSTFDNIIHFYRVRVTAYTSGSADVTIAYGGDSGSGVCRVTAYNSATSVNVEVLQDFKAAIATDNWLEGEWSDRRGWPSAVSFFDGRLWFLRKDQFWGSESDGFTLFNLDTEGDSASIQRSIATGGSVNTGVAMLALQRLMFLTTGSESTARASSFDEPLTPTNTSVKDASTQGAALVSPVKLDGRGIFVQKSQTKLYQVVYSFEANDYTSKNLNRLNEDIGGSGIVELCVQRQPETYVWAVRADGIGLILLYDDAEEALGWFTVETDGIIESMFVLPGDVQDTLYAWVQRTIAGSTVRYREKMAMVSEARGAAVTKLADSGLYSSSASTGITLAHLASETGLIGWGTSTAGVKTVLSGLTASTAGAVDLGASYSDRYVGLPYTGRYKSAKLAYGAQGGTALLQRKTVNQIGLLAADVHRDAIKVGPDFDHLTKFSIRGSNGQALADADAVKTAHDAIAQPLGGTWDTDSRLCIEVQPGHPATILGIVFDVDTNE